jgi:FixJ family two-component response regulator
MAELTRRARQVLDRIAEGGSTKEIAQALGISRKTVAFSRSSRRRRAGGRAASRGSGVGAGAHERPRPTGPRDRDRVG